VRNRGFTLIEILIVLAIVGLLAFIVFNRPASAEDLDPRAPAFTTGVTVGPFHGGNSWPYTGTGIIIPLDHTTGPNAAADFMDWRALQAHRVGQAVEELLETVTFDFDSAELDEVDGFLLTHVAMVLIDNPEVSLVLGGHTDLVGTEDYNHELSLKRAVAVEAALISRGVEPDRLDVAALGETLPVELVTGPSEHNRRVEVVPVIDLP